MKSLLSVSISCFSISFSPYEMFHVIWYTDLPYASFHMVQYSYESANTFHSRFLRSAFSPRQSILPLFLHSPHSPLPLIRILRLQHFFKSSRSIERHQWAAVENAPDHDRVPDHAPLLPPIDPLLPTAAAATVQWTENDSKKNVDNEWHASVLKIERRNNK